jgi:hypothetical protein
VRLGDRKGVIEAVNEQKTLLVAALDRLVREATAPAPTSPPMINDQGD